MISEEYKGTGAAAAEEPAWDQKEMSLTEHLRELRNRLLIVIVTVGVISIFAFLPSQYVIPWMVHMYFPPEIQLHAFGPADVIAVEFKLSLLAGVVVGLPVLLYQFWMFVVPAIHPHARRVVYAYVAPSFFLALGGMAFCHFLILPHVVKALLLMTSHVAVPTFGISQTLGLILIMLLIFALIFQLPVVAVVLARLGFIDAAKMRGYRRYVFMAFMVAGGIAAPDGNPLTMALIAVPMYLLYEGSIVVVALLEKSWKAADPFR
ncbi:MAG: twin-arginine translocase subunit TatC [bacterium]|nr:twin-arginine translocase subunit TatC [bacterium]